MSRAPQRLIVTADDIGLTQGNTDSILECVDAGVVTCVSMLPNGDALTYAAKECASRGTRLVTAIHVNLTVGKPCAPTEELPDLLSKEGTFRYSPFGLWMAFVFASNKKKESLRVQVGRELSMQVETVRTALAQHGISLVWANGHQHVHMIPFVFDSLVRLEGLEHVRITNEPVFISPTSWTSYFHPRLAGVFVLGILSRRNKEAAKKLSRTFNDYFVGLLCSGKMTYEATHIALATVLDYADDRTQTTEVLFHPGSACTHEFFPWKESVLEQHWHFSPWRNRERELLKQTEMQEVFSRFTGGTLVSVWSEVLRIIRFGISGSTSAAVAILLLYVLTEWFGLWYMVSAFIALSFSFVVSFVLQKYWTFANRRTITLPKQLAAFFVMNAFNIGLNALGLYLLVEYVHIWYVAAEFLVAAIIALWTFGIMHFVIFPRRGER
ncbi:MAG: ChbG/HpnK family deacetylase [Candidatus Pacebacteria bacterium]|nr:ChbG/HpnK family deacetylase [Candidatus Paceibacterota bacterium]